MFPGSTFHAPQHLLRRADGRLVPVSETVHAVAAALDGETGVEGLAARVSGACGRPVDASEVAHLLRTPLLPEGLLRQSPPGGGANEAGRPDDRAGRAGRAGRDGRDGAAAATRPSRRGTPERTRRVVGAAPGRGIDRSRPTLVLVTVPRLEPRPAG